MDDKHDNEEVDFHVRLDVQLTLETLCTPKDKQMIEKIIRGFSLKELIEMSTLTAYEIINVKEV